MADSSYVPRLGDHVKHGPSGETWVVAFADAERDELAWIGWPRGWARLHDCEFVRQATPEERLRYIDLFFQNRDETDFRFRRVRWELERALTGAGL